MGGSYARPKNPQSIPSTKIRMFDGIGGPRTQILKKFNYKGWDLSNTVANEIYDLHPAEKGSMLLRPGERRLGSEDYTIGWIGQMHIGGILRYGIIYNNGLSMIDIPMRMGYDLIEWPEDDAAKPSDWPIGWYWEGDAVDDSLPEDPSVPLDEQACTVGYVWANSPSVAVFSMPYADTITPTYINWYHSETGYRPDTPLVGRYTTSPAWLDTALLQGISLVLGPCLGVQFGGIRFTPNGKDVDSNWLEPGVYTSTKVLTWSDGEVMDCAVTLTVLGPEIALSPTTWEEEMVIASETGNKTETINIENTGDAGSSLVWEYVLTGDTEITSILTADKSTGTLAKGADEDVVFTLTYPGGLFVGQYSATITFRDSRLNTITGTVNIGVTVLPAYAGNIATHLVKVNQVGTTLFDETAVYQASSGDFETYWVCLIGGQWMACGKLVATGAWVIRYADQAFWDQDGSWPFAPSLYQIPLTSFNGNGCPTGTYEWKLPNRTPQSTYTITLSEA